MSDDLITEAGARVFVEDMKRFAVERFNRDHDLAPTMVMIETRDPDTGADLPEPRLAFYMVDSSIINDHGSRGQKPALSLMLKAKARRSRAVGWCWMSEAWALTGEGPKPDGSWEHAPGRQEVIMFNYQHVALGPDTHRVEAEIIRPRRGAPHVGPWRNEGLSKGRFADILPRVDA